MKDDEDQLNLLAIFYYVLACLSAVFSCFPLIYVGFGIAIVTGKLAELTKGQGGEPPPEFVGWILIAIGVAAVLMGLAYVACLALTGRSIQKRKWYTFCLVIAGFSCLQVPFGTCLGVFTFIVLLRPSVKVLFQSAPIPEPPGDPWTITG